MQRASDLLLGVSMFAEPVSIRIFDRANSAMNELCNIGIRGKPLWHQHKPDRYEILNNIEYLKYSGRVDAALMDIVKLAEVGEFQALPSFDLYGNPINSTSNENSVQGLRMEASRDTSIINAGPLDIVELLMNVNQWWMTFHKIVSRATILGSFMNSVEGSYDGKLHVLNAEFHLPSPVVPTRECCFARYCKQFSPNDWVVVDVSLEDIFPYPSNNFRRRPSGCLIKGMPNGCSKVTWVEHVEADHSQLNDLFKPLVTSGLSFGATRWLASIVRHFDWSKTLEATQFYSDGKVFIPQRGRASLLKLADRMMRKFCANLSATTTNPWMRLAPFPGSTDIRVMIPNNMPGTSSNPVGTTIVFSTTIWLNISPNRLFNFLRHEKSRNKWDILSQSLSIQQFACMTVGEHLENRVSLLRASNSEDKTEIFYLQESYADEAASYVIYAPLDESALIHLAKGSNPDNVIAFPSGFAIIPGGLPKKGDKGNSTASNESLLTISFNLIDKASIITSIPPESVQTIYEIITETVTAIKDALSCHSQLNNWVQDELKNGAGKK
ncbi:homeobox-leucine zipper protein PROTODERMAL FACTOR 2-like [Vicia villosa]|uniref:homeobox-leucine zipper protein PROTODERMAL FACTOR 2-like n=1 Tax=Vicia villosa TaxID=3911 RepID=UPI00273CA999|nr:homeobox-leucine zipper protein PROTODERMAL FACTOR 2-like [Vicia villosa]